MTLNTHLSDTINRACTSSLVCQSAHEIDDHNQSVHLLMVSEASVIGQQRARETGVARYSVLGAGCRSHGEPKLAVAGRRLDRVLRLATMPGLATASYGHCSIDSHAGCQNCSALAIIVRRRTSGQCDRRRPSRTTRL